MKVDIDITSKAAEKSIDAVKEFLQKLIGPPIDEIGLLMADNVRLWRFKNQIRIAQKADEYIKSRNLTTKQISLKILAPLLEGASLEEEEELQDKWASLLVNYVDSRKNLTATIFPYILTQISSVEARVLEYIAGDPMDNFGDQGQVDRYRIWKKFELSGTELSNLIRLGLIKEVFEINSEDIPYSFGGISPEISVKKVPDIQATRLGIEFLEACKLEYKNPDSDSE
jgi:hypothetical protein